MESTSALEATTVDPIRVARGMLRDQLRRLPWIYWCDLAVTLVVAYGSFAMVDDRHLLRPVPAMLMVLSMLAFYRGVLFTHELVHMGPREMRGFKAAWMAAFGTPLLMPSFTYDMHREHHSVRLYATRRDGEYLREMQDGHPYRAVRLVLVAPLALPAFVVRFGVISPLAWCCPPVRRWADVRASSLIVDPSYARDRPTPEERPGWNLGEAACFAWVALAASLLATGRVATGRLFEAYIVMTLMTALNACRVIGEHRYVVADRTATLTEQVQDSFNYRQRVPLAALWGPLGLRYHGVHHLFPGMPYHALGRAFRRLCADPRTSDLMVVRRSLFTTIPEVLRYERAAP